MRTPAEPTKDQFLSAADGSNSASMIRWLTILGIAISVGILMVGALMLLDARQDVWRQAEQASNNLALTLERDIARNISTLDLSLQGAAKALKLPGIDQVNPDIRQMALFDRAASAEFLGTLLILNADGNIVVEADSVVPQAVYLGDRDYFRIHQEQPNAGLYISHPYLSRLEPGEPRIAFTHRLSGPAGQFEGIVMSALKLAYFHHLFEKLELGTNGVATVLRADGQIIARFPSAADDINRNIGGSENFRRESAQSSGTFVATSIMDGIKRFYTFRHIENLPMILSVGLAVDEIYAPWWRKAAAIGALMTILCSATVSLCLLFRREMLRRIKAEKASMALAETLTKMAAIDGLTQIANRRSFDLALQKEWKRAIRDQTSIALLMLDVDYFKAYNDTYGHQAGDKILQDIAGCIRQKLYRPCDLAARYGGEEFAVLLPTTEFNGALVVAERIRLAIERLDIPHSGSPGKRVTVSIGIGVAQPQLDELEDAVVAEADKALYDAKQTGRNRVGCAGVSDRLRLIEPAAT